MVRSLSEGGVTFVDDYLHGTVITDQRYPFRAKAWIPARAEITKASIDNNFAHPFSDKFNDLNQRTER